MEKKIESGFSPPSQVWVSFMRMMAAFLLFIITMAIGATFWVSKINHDVEDISGSLQRIEAILKDNWTKSDDLTWRDQFFDLNPELKRPTAGLKR